MDFFRDIFSSAFEKGALVRLLKSFVMFFECAFLTIWTHFVFFGLPILLAILLFAVADLQHVILRHAWAVVSSLFQLIPTSFFVNASTGSEWKDINSNHVILSFTISILSCIVFWSAI